MLEHECAELAVMSGVDRNYESPIDNRFVSPIQSLNTEKATVKTDSRFSPAESWQKQFSLCGESRG